MTNAKLLLYLCEDLSLKHDSVRSAISLFDDGATIPFIARYRKERTQGLDETELRHIQTRYEYYNSLFLRQESILNTIDEQGKLSAELKHKIETCKDKQRLEDLYLPYKKRRKTKADTAIENGLQPLADIIMSQSYLNSRAEMLERFVSESVETGELAVAGALHIIAQTISDNAQYRAWIRDVMMKTGVLTTSVTSAFKDKKTKFDMYYSFSERLQSAASHRLLAIRRGEKEKVLNWKIGVDTDNVLTYLESKIYLNRENVFKNDLKFAIKDAFTRLIDPSLQNECFNAQCAEAETASIQVFVRNLENLLMSPPTGSKVVLGIDPGFRTGCKCAIVDENGRYVCTKTIFPVPPFEKMKEAESVILDFVKTYNVAYIAIGNGTGSKETMQFIKSVIKSNKLTCVPVIVNESGASVYSASELAIKEYPDLDVTVRGAISIAHRLQDPLAELVKIDPKSIGVGQYQHDVNQVQLKEALTFTTELVVNTIGVDLNTASEALLTYVSGIGPTIAKNIIEYREKNGSFNDRKSVLKVPKLGPKVFEQCSGFLRIKGAKNSLDNSSIHPESYKLVTQISKDFGVSVDRLIGNESMINSIKLENYCTDTIGLPTLKDIVKELLKPGVDPRAEFDYAQFADDIDDIKDLKEGMVLEGCVTNVTNFGAFVDIGVHQDGLIHISKLSNTFVKNPNDVVSVGDKVTVTVIGVDVDLKRIQLANKLD